MAGPTLIHSHVNINKNSKVKHYLGDIDKPKKIKVDITMDKKMRKYSK